MIRQRQNHLTSLTTAGNPEDIRDHDPDFIFIRSLFKKAMSDH